MRERKPCPDCGGERPHWHKVCEACAEKRVQARVDANRMPCQECGGPKPKGSGRRLCDECAQTCVNSPFKKRVCKDCGDPKPPGSGRRFCDECLELHEWRSRQREKAREARDRMPCRGCGRPKGPGRTNYCPTCQKARQTVLCRRCHRPKPRGSGSQLCEACIPLKTRGPKPCAGCGGVKEPGAGRQYCDRCLRSKRARRKITVRESNRIGYRLRAELNGRSLDEIPVVSPIGENRTRRLPVEPLHEFVTGLIRARVDSFNGHTTQMVCEQLGISERNWRHWGAEAKTVAPQTVETVLSATDAMWWEVYDKERYPEAHELAREAFTS